MSRKKSIHHSFIVRYGVPSEWSEVRLRDAAQIVGGGTPDSTEPRYWNGGIPWLTPTEMTGLRGRTATSSERTITQVALDSSNCRLLPVGALVLSTRGTIGNLAIAGVPLTCNQSCEALLPRDGVVCTEYLYYLLVFLRPLLERLGAGTTFASITRRDIRDIRFSLPAPDEQQPIASLLVGVDDAIAAAQEKLKVATKLKRALMQQVFTHGIPGRHLRFKRTKIGETPETWDVVTVQSLLDGAPFSGVSPLSRSDPPGTPILNVECIDDGVCSTKHTSYVDVDEQTLGECRAKNGDFYVLRGNGNRDYVATGGLLSEEPELPTIFSDKLIRLRFKASEVVERFVPYVWQSPQFLHRLQSKAESGSGLWMISKRDIRRELVARPRCQKEQQEIVALVDAAIAGITACDTEILALEQLRQSLMQHLLTGRARIRRI